MSNLSLVPIANLALQESFRGYSELVHVVRRRKKFEWIYPPAVVTHIETVIGSCLQTTRASQSAMTAESVVTIEA